MPAENIANSQRALAALAVALATVMFILPLAIPFPLVDPDEGLHASIAQEMAEGGDWIIPRFLGQPFLDKPVFYFWVQAASLKLFGSCEAAVRLPGLMFGLLGAVTTGLLGWRMFGRATGLIAGILYATTILPTALAQAASHDVALIPWINLSLLLLWEGEHRGDRRVAVLCTLGAGISLGLAVLTKGLFGVAAVGLAYGGYLAITRRINSAAILRGVAVLATAALISAPWYLAAEMQMPNYLRYFFLERHVLGFTTGSQPHGDQAWWYYLPILLGGGLPWIGYLPLVVQQQWACRGGDCPHFRGHRGTAVVDEKGTVPFVSPMPLLWCWLIGWTLLMALAGSKLATYLLPAFPPIAILAATAWHGLIVGSLLPNVQRAFTRTFVYSTWSGPLVLPAVVLAVRITFGAHFGWPVWIAVGVAAAVSLLPIVPWRAGRWQAGLIAAVISLALQFVVILTMVLPPVAEEFSARDLAEHFNRAGHLPSRLLIAEGRLGSLVFYLNHRLRAEIDPNRVQQVTAEELPALVPGDVVAVPQRKIRNFRRYHNLDGNRDKSVDGYQLYYVDSPGSPSAGVEP